jgi:hypothetical protein
MSLISLARNPELTVDPNGFVCPDDFSIYTSADFDQLVRETERGRPSMLTIGMHPRISATPARFTPSKAFWSVWRHSAIRCTFAAFSFDERPCDFRQ